MLTMIVLAGTAILCSMLSYNACIAPFKKDIEEAESVEKARLERARRDAKAAPSDDGALKRAAAIIERVFPITRDVEQAYREKLDRAGVKASSAVWRGMTIAIAIAGLAAGILLGSLLQIGYLGILVCGMLGALAGWGGCSLDLMAKTKARKAEIEKILPDALERLATVVSSGMSFDEAFREVAKSDGMGPLGEEFARVDREINLVNATREEALAGMAKRCQSVDVTFFTSAVIQATREGSSIRGTLQQQSQIARSAWFDRLRERINKIDTKITIPLGLCFMPTALLMIVTPILVQALSQLGTIF